MPGPLFLGGEDVSLRTIEREDLEFCQRWVNDPEVRHGLDASHPVNADGEAAWYESLADSDDVHLLACVDGDPVGTLGLNGLDERVGSAELGYWIAPEYHGRGYATAASRLLVEYGFDERRLHKVIARAYDFNDASRRVLEKLGFEREGTFREEAFVDGTHVDVYRYGLLESEWRA